MAHTVAPDMEVLPDPHAVHALDALAPEYVFEGQFVQVFILVAATTPEYFPAKHPVHTVAPAAEYFPATQLTHVPVRMFVLHEANVLHSQHFPHTESIKQ